MAYVDGFVIPVKAAMLDRYKQVAAAAGEIWMSHGATSYAEAVGDDVPVGEQTSFPRAVQLAEDEVVIFSWITYPDRETRDACNAKVMEDERMKALMADMPFEGKRMIYGGFEAFLQR